MFLLYVYRFLKENVVIYNKLNVSKFKSYDTPFDYEQA